MVSTVVKRQEETECLICGKFTGQMKKLNSLHSAVPDKLTSTIEIYFVLKSVLLLPDDRLVNYLQCCTTFESRIKFCHDCRLNYVDKCMQIHGELMDIQRRQAEAHAQFRKAIKQSIEETSGRKLRRKTRSSLSTSSITQEIRDFVNTLVTEGEVRVNPFLEGDLQARRLQGEIESAKDLSLFNQTVVNTEADRNAAAKSVEITVIVKEESMPCTLSDEFDDHSPAELPEPDSLSGLLESGASDFAAMDEAICMEKVSIGKSGSGSNEDGGDRRLAQKRHRCFRKRMKVEFAPPFDSLKKDSKTKLYKCPSCEATNSKKFNLYAHYTSKHLNQPFLQCDWPNCGQSFVKKCSYLSHMDRHKGTPRFSCTQCDRKFYRYTERTCHRQRVHEGGALKKQFICTVCKKGFVDANSRTNHRRLCPRKPKPTQERKDPLSGIQRIAGKFRCPSCDHSALTKTGLSLHFEARHLLIRHKCTWQGCDKSFVVKTQLRNHVDWHNKTPRYKCEQCSEAFYNDRHLSRHRQSIHEGGNFMCDQCGKGFANNEWLQAHKRVVHLKIPFVKKKILRQEKDDKATVGERKRKRTPRKRKVVHRTKQAEGANKTDNKQMDKKIYGCRSDLEGFKLKKKRVYSKRPVICPQCGETVKECYLWRHTKTKHETPKVPCPHCEKMFPFENELRRHLKVKHSIIYSAFTCDVVGCKKICTSESQYKTHMDEFHGPDKSKPGQFKCQYCEKTFFNRNVLRNHERSQHEDPEKFKCAECGKGFPIKTNLARHLHISHGITEHTFRCDVVMCKKFCLDEEALKIHMEEIHGPDRTKPGKFGCKLCTATFFALGFLRQHERSIHRIQHEYLVTKKT